VQLCEAVRYIHSKDVVHRDIKSQNVFITEDGTVKLGDFGLSTLTKSIKTKTIHSQVGTDCYLSPELLQGKMYMKGKAADMWCMGLVLLELCSLKFSWEYESDLGLKSITEPHHILEIIDSLPQRYDKKMRALIKRLLHKDPADRPTIEQVLKKKFIKLYKSNPRPQVNNSRRSKTPKKKSSRTSQKGGSN